MGYVVISDAGGQVASESVQAQLHDDLDLEGDSVPDLAHYRLIQHGDAVTTYAVVPGATVHVNGSTDFDIASTTVVVDGETASYERSFETVDNSSVAVTVAYPGEYEIGDGIVEVNENDVVNGETINVSATDVDQ